MHATVHFIRNIVWTCDPNLLWHPLSWKWWIKFWHIISIICTLFFVGSVKHIEMERRTLCVEVELLFSTLRWSLSPCTCKGDTGQTWGRHRCSPFIFVDTPRLFGLNHPSFLMLASKETIVKHIHLAWWHQDVSMFTVTAQLQDNSSS